MLVLKFTLWLATLWALLNIATSLMSLDANLTRLDRLPTTETIIIPVPPPDASRWQALEPHELEQ